MSGGSFDTRRADVVRAATHGAWDYLAFANYLGSEGDFRFTATVSVQPKPEAVGTPVHHFLRLKPVRPTPARVVHYVPCVATADRRDASAAIKPVLAGMLRKVSHLVKVESE